MTLLCIQVPAEGGHEHAARGGRDERCGRPGQVPRQDCLDAGTSSRLPRHRYLGRTALTQVPRQDCLDAGTSSGLPGRSTSSGQPGRRYLIRTAWTQVPRQDCLDEGTLSGLNGNRCLVLTA